MGPTSVDHRVSAADLVELGYDANEKLFMIDI